MSMGRATPGSHAHDYRRGLAAIRAEHELPDAFPSPVADAAVAAAADDGWRRNRTDRTDLAMQTLDPVGSVDLDQAFAVTVDGPDVVLHYALADVAAFAPLGGPVETEAWQRGVTVYLPDGRVPVYPTVLSEQAASLLPDGPRPCVLLEVAVAPDGTPVLRDASRAIVASRKKGAYETTAVADLHPAVAELHRRMDAAERRRGATKVDWPEQRVEADPTTPAGVRLVLRPISGSEDVNSSLSLAANLAVATVMLEARDGLFRVLPEPDLRRQAVLRRTAAALGIDWPEAMALRELMPSLDPDNPAHRRLLMETRRAGRGASYARFDPANPPWHSALAAVYAHATAPMRRLADRYVLEHVLALVHGDPSPVEAQLDALPDVMARAEGRAGAVDRAVIDLVEAIELCDRVGEVFPATVIEVGRGATVVQLADPPVRARAVEPDGVDAAEGDPVRVRLVAADVEARRVSLAVEPTSRPTA